MPLTVYRGIYIYKMQHNGVDTEHNYVNMRDNYVNIMRLNMIMLPVAIIHISHGFEGDIPDYPASDRNLEI